MATAEAETSRDERSPPGGVVYDGFISYSHAADDLLAPRLQAGLQRFAKPWWRRRALRIFRDETSLSANPHLWSSIADALDRSGWLILLLSPDAAQSEWVNQEIEYWLEHKDPDRIIPVLTDGQFGWGDGDVTGDAVPPALHDTFSDEPRWVDLRFARSEEQLDLKNPRFSAGVADVASALRGVPKDELESEEVRQHRRAIRTAWAATGALVILAVAAVTLGMRADQQADIARAREFAAAAVAVLEEDPELSMMLALQSIGGANNASPAGVMALRKAKQANRLVAQFDLHEPTASSISYDGGTIYYSSSHNKSVTAVEASTGEELWVYNAPASIDAVGRVSVSPDQALVAVATFSSPDTGGPAAQLMVLSAEDGHVVEQLGSSGCPDPDMVGRFSPDGSWLAISDGSAVCVTDPDASWVSVYNSSTWAQAHRLEIPGVWGEEIQFSADSSRVLINGWHDAPSELRGFPDLELINTFENAVALSPDGEKVVVERQTGGEIRPLLLEAITGNRIAFLDAVERFLSGTEPVLFSPDGSTIAVATIGGGYVFNAETGELITRLPQRGFTTSQAFMGDGSSLLSSNSQSAFLWQVEGHLDPVGFPVHGGEMGWMNPNSVVDGPNLAVWVVVWIEDEPAYRGRLLDPTSGEIIGTFDGYGVQLRDGRIVIERVEATDDKEGLFSTEDGLFGPIEVWDPTTGDSEFLTDCTAIKSPYTWEVGTIQCATDEILFPYAPSPIVFGLTVSSDGNLIVADSYAPEGSDKKVRVWDATTLEVRSEFAIDREFTLAAAGGDWVAHVDPSTERLRVHDIETGAILAEPEGAFFIVSEQLASGSFLVMTDRTGDLIVFDTTTWETTARWPAHAASVRGLVISPDETTLATTGEDDTVRIWNISALEDLVPGQPPPLLDEIPAPKPSDAAWLSETRLAVFLANGALWLEVSLDVNDLVADARSRLTRGFTLIECATYHLDPCPTLDEIKSGSA